MTMKIQDIMSFEPNTVTPDTPRSRGSLERLSGSRGHDRSRCDLHGR